MKITVNQHDGCGTSLQGRIELNYDQIVDRLGEPTDGDGFKVDAQWIVHHEDSDVIATIYNWKDGRNYWGADGTPVNQITDWHIGGFDVDAVDLVHNLFKEEVEAEINPCELALCEPESDPTSAHHHSYLESDDFEPTNCMEVCDDHEWKCPDGSVCERHEDTYEPSTDGAPCGYDDTHGL